MNQALPVVAAATVLFMAGAPARPAGLNEYVSVKSLLECRDFLYRLVKIYADQR
jgi:acetylornithine deacetylase/succinyl-diaminopimelate desuccinylase-like protein